MSDLAEATLAALYPATVGVGRWRDDPAGFVQHCIDWDGLDGPTDYQLDTLNLLVEHRRVAVRGPHGLGKTAENAWVVHWFALSRDAAGDDWKIPTTASAWRQLTKYLWPEIRKWARRLRWDQIGRRPYDERTELLNQSLRLETGEAFAVACDDPATIEGCHAEQILYIFDEGKAIPDGTFDAAEGAFSGAGDDTTAEAYALASSTPAVPAGRFYDLCRSAPGFEDWHPTHITKSQVVEAGRMSQSWAEQRARQWGTDSAVYQNRVDGEFAASEENSVVPLAWVEAAQARWQTLNDAGWPDSPPDAVGVDVAREGADSTALALRAGMTVTELRLTSKEDTMQTTGRVVAALAGGNGTAVVDVIGVGGGVVDRLREQGHQVDAFNASHKTDRTDITGELGFVNTRSAAWWHLREILDPDSDDPVALPDDDQLVGDLTAPTWQVTSTGKIAVEPKDDIRKRLRRSTDVGDAVIQVFWFGSGPPPQSLDLSPGGTKQTSHWRQ